MLLQTMNKNKTKNLSIKDITSKTLANEQIENIYTHASGNKANIGGLKVTTRKWLVCSSSFWELKIFIKFMQKVL